MAVLLAVVAAVAAAGSMPARAEAPPGGEEAAQLVPHPGMAYRSILPFLAVAGAAAVASPAVPPGEALLGLQADLQAAIDATAVTGRFAVAVTDLQTGETVGVNHDRPHLSGCIMNLFVILAALRDVEAGVDSLDAVDATIRQTIYASDATTARDLYIRHGGRDVYEGVKRVSRLLSDVLNLAVSHVDHPPSYPWETEGSFEDNLITTREVNAALAQLYHGEVLGTELTGWLLGAMTGVKPGLNYLTATLPDGPTVSHKNGFFWNPGDGWVDNDTAIVRFGPGNEYAYAITFLSEGVTTLYADIPLGQHLVRLAWDHFSARYN